MFKFLRSGASKDASDSVLRSESIPVPETVAPQSSRTHSDFRHELVRVVLKDTLRRRGIPYDWLSCEVIVVPRGVKHEELHIQLTLLKWSELFLRYAPALEYQLLQGLDRFEPAVDHSGYIISWRFSPDCGCPFTVMPPPMIWAHAEAPVAEPEEAPSILDRRKARRPPKKPVSDVVASVEPPKPAPTDDGEFERTRLSPLR
jgi:hypothetical protein